MVAIRIILYGLMPVATLIFFTRGLAGLFVRRAE
jgi:hypothetical protein